MNNDILMNKIPMLYCIYEDYTDVIFTFYTPKFMDDLKISRALLY
jgi:hypothetical protein